ncbi:3-hydroxyacyl-[acyl-carrier-protein] dehydratase [Segatella baroniae B14]|nr:beta-hydroxyacyl-ACP dehydratase [Prevotella sp.]SDL45307.1 3-hydroxyacyl-[acyl-carrier-protein] dehydratase [Segatella bryantii]SEA27667.1 3-hydroxyacyl-[acyl-carrier-protein] dehydratase [Segatella bryantii]SEP84609.1 3-hydroxyacyl-[acyl-carrier-protein] dehydratase [Segatella baroniae B14]
MLLLNKFYRVVSREEKDNNIVFHVELLPECDVYQGHFPGNPVSPGVCNIEMIKECVMQVVGRKLVMNKLDRCRLTAVASPSVCPTLDVTVHVEEGESSVKVLASIADAQQQYMDFKGEMI